MDPVTLTVVLKGIGMLVALAGGILIASWGFRLYRDGAGAGRDRAGFELGSVKLKAHSVGSVVMSTAFLWAWAGVTLSPNLDKKGDAVRIYSMTTPSGEIEAVALTTKAPDAQTAKTDPERLKQLYSRAATTAEKASSGSVAQLDGKPASVDLGSVKAFPTAGGEYWLSTRVTTGDKTATLTYEPKSTGGQLTFVPNWDSSLKSKN